MQLNPPEARIIGLFFKRTEKDENRDLLRGQLIKQLLGRVPYSQIKTYFRIYLNHIQEEQIRQAVGAELIEHNKQLTGL